jgi:FkbM family methyltransferase
MFVDLRSAIGRGIFAIGEFDPAVFGPLRAALKPGGTFLDIGANVGFYSMLALDAVGPAGAVHAFEIDERPLQCLRKTISRERIDNLFIHELAVGQTDRVVGVATRKDSGHSGVVEHGGTRQIEMVTLDSWWRASQIKNLQAIKLDIEGGELPALEGAGEMLRETRPVIVCEAEEELQKGFGYRLSDLLQHLRELGYRSSFLEDVWSATLVAIPE